MFEDQPSCECKTCVRMCQTPCWPTPEEAQILIDAGLGNRLMVARNMALVPAVPGYEGEYGPEYAGGLGCTFHREGKCQIHDMKPSEGRKAIHNMPDPTGLHQSIVETWENSEAQKLVGRWTNEA